MTVTEITNVTHGCRRTEDCYVLVPAFLSHTGGKRWANEPVDKCLAPVINALNGVGLYTASSCCGHGIAPGSIVFHDGSELVLAQCLHQKFSSPDHPSE